MKAVCGRCGGHVEYLGERALKQPRHAPGEARVDLDVEGNLYVVCEECERLTTHWLTLTRPGVEA